VLPPLWGVVLSDPVLIYHQGSGLIRKVDGTFVALGWAGNGLGKNNPSWQHQKNEGPLPRGIYEVGPWEEEHAGLGPIVASLKQIQGETYGRSGFYFHGPAMDSAKFGQESRGCIVVPRAGRLKVKDLAPEGSLIEVVV